MTTRGWRRWLFQESREEKSSDPSHNPANPHSSHPWWQVVCLTGVDYFSTLGYQPSIAIAAAGLLSPIATLVLVLFTLFGVLPMYRYLAAVSPHGQGSFSLLERLLSFWPSKLLILCLLGFAATDFIITITLSAADASAHLIENPFFPKAFDQPILLTLIFVIILGGVFLKGFKEAVGIAVVLVVGYISLNVLVVGRGMLELFQHPEAFQNWQSALGASHSSALGLALAGMLIFPKLALGLSGFETGVVLMPQIRGKVGDNPQVPQGRIGNTRKLLSSSAIIMSILLLLSSLVCTLLIPLEAFKTGGPADGRALALLAHQYFGDGIGTAYDLFTIFILWFAGASAMAGLLNIVPRYLPRYGMAPDWTRAARPLILVFTLISCLVTVGFKANVNAQGSAYATGVIVLMGSAALAVTLQVWKKRMVWKTLFFGLVFIIFGYVLGTLIYDDATGLRLAGFFIAIIVAISLVSRVLRSTELRVEEIRLDNPARALLAKLLKPGTRLQIVAHRRNQGTLAEYQDKLRRIHDDTFLDLESPSIFLELWVDDASDFSDVLEITGVEVGPHMVLRGQCSSVANGLAAFLLYLRDHSGQVPHIYFGWTEGNPVLFLLRFFLFGEGDVAPLTRAILQRAEKRADQRPKVHVGG